MVYINMSLSSSFSVSLQFSLHSPAQYSIHIWCAALRSKTFFSIFFNILFKREQCCLSQEWMQRWAWMKHWRWGNTIPKVKHLPKQWMTLYVPPPWCKKIKKKNAFPVIFLHAQFNRRRRRSHHLFQEVFGEFSHIVRGSADASFSVILHSVTPSAKASLLLF